MKATCKHVIETATVVKNYCTYNYSKVMPYNNPTLIINTNIIFNGLASILLCLSVLLRNFSTILIDFDPLNFYGFFYPYACPLFCHLSGER